MATVEARGSADTDPTTGCHRAEVNDATGRHQRRKWCCPRPDQRHHDLHLQVSTRLDS